MNDRQADRFDAVVDAVHALQQAAAALETAKQAFADAKDRVCDETAALLPSDRSGPTTDPQVIALLRHLYWTQPVIPAQHLADGGGYPSIKALLDAIGSTPSGIACAICGRDLARTSRSWTPHPRRLCNWCAAAEKSRDQQRWAAERLRDVYVGSGNVPGVVGDWRLAVRIVLAYPPVSTNVEPGTEADRQLGVWNEYDSALYVEKVLGGAAEDASCAVPVVPGLLLVETAQNVASWDSERVCALTADITDEAPSYVLARLADQIEEYQRERKAAAARRYPDGYEATREDREWMWNAHEWRRAVRDLPENF